MSECAKERSKERSVKKTLVMVLMLALFAPGMSAAGPRDREPRFVLRKIIKRIVGAISTLGDEILTGGKP
jgi:hypothetical protein